MNIGAYTKPIFDKIIAEEKWYANIQTGFNEKGEPTFMSPQHAFKVKRNFKNGTIGWNTLRRVLEHFGYEIQEIIWIKKK